MSPVFFGDGMGDAGKFWLSWLPGGVSATEAGVPEEARDGGFGVDAASSPARRPVDSKGFAGVVED